MSLDFRKPELCFNAFQAGKAVLQAFATPASLAKPDFPKSIAPASLYRSKR